MAVASQSSDLTRRRLVLDCLTVECVVPRPPRSGCPYRAIVHGSLGKTRRLLQSPPSRAPGRGSCAIVAGALRGVSALRPLGEEERRHTGRETFFSRSRARAVLPAQGRRRRPAAARPVPFSGSSAPKARLPTALRGECLRTLRRSSRRRARPLQRRAGECDRCSQRCCAHGQSRSAGRRWRARRRSRRRGPGSPPCRGARAGRTSARADLPR